MATLTAMQTRRLRQTSTPSTIQDNYYDHDLEHETKSSELYMLDHRIEFKRVEASMAERTLNMAISNLKIAEAEQRMKATLLQVTKRDLRDAREDLEETKRVKEDVWRSLEDVRAMIGEANLELEMVLDQVQEAKANLQRYGTELELQGKIVKQDPTNASDDFSGSQDSVANASRGRRLDRSDVSLGLLCLAVVPSGLLILVAVVLSPKLLLGPASMVSAVWVLCNGVLYWATPGVEEIRQGFDDKDSHEAENDDLDDETGGEKAEVTTKQEGVVADLESLTQTHQPVGSVFDFCEDAIKTYYSDDDEEILLLVTLAPCLILSLAALGAPELLRVPILAVALCWLICTQLAWWYTYCDEDIEEPMKQVPAIESDGLQDEGEDETLQEAESHLSSRLPGEWSSDDDDEASIPLRLVAIYTSTLIVPWIPYIVAGCLMVGFSKWLLRNVEARIDHAVCPHVGTVLIEQEEDEEWDLVDGDEG